jgi:methionyl-tRNA formyltransferase
LIWRARVVAHATHYTDDTDNSGDTGIEHAMNLESADNDNGDQNDASGSAARGADAAPGTVTELKPEPVVKCGNGSLALIEVQAPGRRRMAAADFMRGRRVVVGTRLGG